MALLSAIFALVPSAASAGQIQAYDGATSCRHGSTARIGGKRVCLRVGARCKKRYANTYCHHGFQCRGGTPEEDPDRAAPPPPPPPPSPGAFTIEAEIDVGHPLGPIVAGEGALWVENRDSTVSRIDPGTSKVVATIPIPFRLGNSASGWIVTAAGSVWVSDYGVNPVTRIDAATNRVVASIPVGDTPTGLAVTPGAVWVADHLGRSLSRIDTATNAVATIPVGDQSNSSAGSKEPQELAVAGGSVWFEAQEASGMMIERLDPTTGAVVAKIPIAGFCEFASDGTSLWIANLDEHKLYPVQLATNTLGTAVDLPFPPFGVQVGLGWIWGVDLGGRGVYRLDRTNGAFGGQTEFPATGGLALGYGKIWVGRNDGKILQVAPMA